MKLPLPCLLTATVIAGLFSVAQVSAAPKLRYAFEPGRRYMYEVKIVATHPDAVETREGLCTYTTKSATDDQFTLGYSASLATRRHSTGGQPVFGRPHLPPHFPWSDSLMSRPGEMTISPLGKIIKTTSLAALPYMLGDLELLVLEELPAEGKSSWELKSDLAITSKSRSRFPHGPIDAGAESGIKRSAQETIKYSVARSAGQAIRIQRDYALLSVEKVDGYPRLELVGKGELVFDVKQGVLQSHTMSYTLRVNETNLTLKVPVTVDCRLLDPAEAEQRLKAKEEARAAAQAAVAKANEPKPLEPGEREKLLRDLKAADEWAPRRAADRLARAPVDGQPGEVAAALTPLLSHRTGSIRAAAAKALGNWATTNSTPALLAVVADEDLWVRKAAMESLGRLQCVEAAQAIATRLTRLSDRGDAAKALKAMGSIAEPAVLPHLKDHDGWVRLDACKILAEIGTAKSIPLLEEFGGNGHGFDKPEAEKAIKAIKARQ